MQASGELLLRQIRLQDLYSVVADYQTCGAVRSNAKACIALSIDSDLALNVYLRAEHLSFLARGHLCPMTLREGQPTRVWIVERGVEKLLAARLACLTSWSTTLMLDLMYTTAFRVVHQEAIDDHISRGCLGLSISCELELT